MTASTPTRPPVARPDESFPWYIGAALAAAVFGGFALAVLLPLAVVLDWNWGVRWRALVQAHGHLNQSLIKPSRRPLRIRPQLFPNLVRLEKIALVEVLDAFQIARIVHRIVEQASCLPINRNQTWNRSEVHHARRVPRPYLCASSASCTRDFCGMP